jgi:hypothetical protein
VVSNKYLTEIISLNGDPFGIVQNIKRFGNMAISCTFEISDSENVAMIKVEYHRFLTDQKIV